MQIQIETITPAIARAMLENNDHNRRLAPSHVRRYAADMAAGQWTINGEAIKIDTAGNLLDGQHRLAAIIVANVAVKTVVARGLDVGTRLTMDQGRKRTTGDQFKLRGIQYPDVHACAAAHLYRWEYGAKWGNTNNLIASVSELLDTRDRWPELAEACALGVSTSRAFRCGVGQGTWAGAYAVALAVNADRARSFAEQCRTGAGLAIGSPVLALRNSFVAFRHSGRTLTRAHALNWIVIAFFDFLDGKSRRQFKRDQRVRDFRNVEGRRIVRPEVAQ